MPESMHGANRSSREPISRTCSTDRCPSSWTRFSFSWWSCP
jgi:hypothetical protein